MNGRIRTAILISGSGSNMEALIRSTLQSDHPAGIVLVISNRPGAAGLEKAKRLGVATQVINHKFFKSRKTFECRLDDILRKADTELICLAGFMRILTPWFVRRWRRRMINIHPSLLPKFKGLHTHARAIEAGETEHGCTVHWVCDSVDEGEIIAQACVPLQEGARLEILAARVLAEEHILYPGVLKQIAEGLQRVNNN